MLFLCVPLVWCKAFLLDNFSGLVLTPSLLFGNCSGLVLTPSLFLHLRIHSGLVLTPPIFFIFGAEPPCLMLSLARRASFLFWEPHSRIHFGSLKTGQVLIQKGKFWGNVKVDKGGFPDNKMSNTRPPWRFRDEDFTMTKWTFFPICISEISRCRNGRWPLYTFPFWRFRDDKMDVGPCTPYNYHEHTQRYSTKKHLCVLAVVPVL